MRAPGEASFRLQCFDVLGILPTHTPDIAVIDDRVFVATVAGLQVFDAHGCRVPTVGGLRDVAVFDIRELADGRLSVVTAQAGIVNDAYFSHDRGQTWQPVGIGSANTLVSRFRPHGAGWIASGAWFDAEAGNATFGLITYGADLASVYIPIDLGDEGHRVWLLDSDPARALVVLDRFDDTDDTLAIFESGALTERWSAPHILDARFGLDGDDAWVVTNEGLHHLRVDGSEGAPLAGVRGVTVSDGTVWVTGEFRYEGFALGRVSGGRVEGVLAFEEITEPSACDDEPATCPLEWDDWAREMLPPPGATPDADAGAVEAAEPAARQASGCATAPPHASAAWMTLAVVGLVVAAAPKRRRARAAADHCAGHAPLTRFADVS